VSYFSLGAVQRDSRLNQITNSQIEVLTDATPLYRAVGKVSI
jgi:hypothetical protein